MGPTGIEAVVIYLAIALMVAPAIVVPWALWRDR